MKDESSNEPSEEAKAEATKVLKDITNTEAEAGTAAVDAALMPLAIAQVTKTMATRTHGDRLAEAEAFANLTGIYLGLLETGMKIAGLMKALHPGISDDLIAAAASFAKRMPKIPPAEITVVHESDCTCPNHAAPKPSWKTPGITGVPRGTTPKTPDQN